MPYISEQKKSPRSNPRKKFQANKNLINAAIYFCEFLELIRIRNVNKQRQTIFLPNARSDQQLIPPEKCTTLFLQFPIKSIVQILQQIHLPRLIGPVLSPFMRRKRPSTCPSQQEHLGTESYTRDQIQETKYCTFFLTFKGNKFLGMNSPLSFTM